MNIIVKLWIREGERDAFLRYEKTAFEVMKDHGIEVLNIEPSSGASPSEPNEIHHLRCEHAEILDRYRADPRLEALSNLRETAIARTEIVVDSEPDVA